MRTLVYAAAFAALLPVGGAQAQSASSAPPSPQQRSQASPANDLTRALNGGAVAAPVTTATVATPAPGQTPAATSAAAGQTVTAAPRAEGAPPPPPIITPAPTPSSPTTSRAPAPAATPAPPAASSSAPTETVLDTAARAALPFAITLPPGFRITTGRPGPDFKIYTVRRGDRSFAMIYVGPSSQFPIYSGETVETAGRTSIIANQDGIRHAMEHLFQRETAPREIHVWIMSLEGADQAMAEQIAQTVDPR